MDDGTYLIEPIGSDASSTGTILPFGEPHILYKLVSPTFRGSSPKHDKPNVPAEEGSHRAHPLSQNTLGQLFLMTDCEQLLHLDRTSGRASDR